MTSRDVNKLVKEGDKGIKELYKIHVRYFDLVDTWSERLTNGDLLNEFEIAESMERLTGCLMKFGVVAGALEAIKEEIEHGTRVKEFAKFDKVRAQDCDIVKAIARDNIKGIRKYATDFRNYFYAAQSGVTTAQSRLKRLTVTKVAKGIGYTGEQPREELTDVKVDTAKMEHIEKGARLTGEKPIEDNTSSAENRPKMKVPIKEEVKKPEEKKSNVW